MNLSIAVLIVLFGAICIDASSGMIKIFGQKEEDGIAHIELGSVPVDFSGDCDNVLVKRIIEFPQVKFT